ncbi:MAG: PH domain-containing protein [Bryobacteraceae bacterium]
MVGRIALVGTALGLLLALWPLKQHIVSRFDRLVVTTDCLRLESRVLRRSSRVMQLSKVQDVRVEQTLWQRLLDTSDLYVEKAGEAGQLFMPNVDSPHEVSAFILSAASSASGEDARAGV